MLDCINRDYQSDNFVSHKHGGNKMSTSLFERLGGNDGITAIANDVVDNHLANKAVANRFAQANIPALKHAAATFFITGTGGENVYKGKNMLAAHKGMNISAIEFMAVLDDALAALAKNNIGQREQEEVLYILYSMRSEIVLV
jgi:hemoglobin